MNGNSCLIWETPAQIVGGDGLFFTINSLRAGGLYSTSMRFANILGQLSDPEKVRLTSWLVEQRRLGISCPEITSTVLEEVKKMRSVSVHDRADNLVRYLGVKSDLLGAVVNFTYHGDETAQGIGHELLAWTGSTKLDEVFRLSEYCQEQGWVKYKNSRPITWDRGTMYYLSLKLPGYARLAALEGTSSRSDQAFVAMWFDNSMTDVYEHGIKSAIEDVGYNPKRIDREAHNEKIDDKIISEIRRSRFLVADFTQGEAGARGGVYYEAGFAHGLNIPVIFTCRRDAIERIHFDTRQYNHIVWETPEELRGALANRISATIGDGPYAAQR